MNLLHPSVHIVDAAIDSIDTRNAYLLVQSGDGFVGFASFHPAEKKVNGWMIYQLADDLSASALEEKLEAIIAAHPWVQKSYHKTIFVQHAAKNILVPVALNKEEDKEYLFELMHGKQKKDLQVKDFVVHQRLVNHYAVDHIIGRLLNQHFPKGEWWHIQSLLLTKNAAGGTRITATIWFNELQLTVENNGQWILLQSYRYHTPEDVLYYILNSMQQLNYTQEETTVVLQGMIDQRSKLYDVLDQYILNLQLNEELQFQFPATTEEQPVHLSASLDQILTCVS